MLQLIKGGYHLDFVFFKLHPISFILIPNESSLQELSNGMPIDPPIYGWSWSVVTTLLHETQDVLVVDLWYSKYMIYSLRAFFTVAHFFRGYSSRAIPEA